MLKGHTAQKLLNKFGSRSWNEYSSDAAETDIVTADGCP